MEFEIGGAKKQRRIIIFCLRVRVTIERSASAVQLLAFFYILLGLDSEESVEFYSSRAISGMSQMARELI